MCLQSIVKWLALICIIFSVFTISFYPKITRAECILQGGGDFRTPNVPIDMGAILILPSDPIGKVVASKRFKVSAFRSPRAVQLRCGSDDQLDINAELIKNSYRNASNSFDTNLNGIGIRISTISDAAFNAFGLQGNYPYQTYFNAQDRNKEYIFNLAAVVNEVVVELIKTSQNVSSGFLEAGQYSRLYQVNANELAWLTTFMTPLGSQIIVPHCQILDQRRRNIQLPNVAINSFKGIGSTAAETRFDMTVSCAEASLQAGQKSQFKLTMFVDFVAEIDQPTVMQNIAGSASAQGIGLELFLINTESQLQLIQRRR